MFKAFSSQKVSVVLQQLKTFGDFVMLNLPGESYTPQMESELIAVLDKNQLLWLEPYVLGMLKEDSLQRKVTNLLTCGLYLKKLQIPNNSELLRLENRAYLKNERHVLKWTQHTARLSKESGRPATFIGVQSGEHTVLCNDILYRAKKLITKWFAKAADITSFKHGSGQVANRVGTSASAKEVYLIGLDVYDSMLKLEAFREWTSQIVSTRGENTLLAHSVLNDAVQHFDPPEYQYSQFTVMLSNWVRDVRRTFQEENADYGTKKWAQKTQVAKSFSALRGITMETVPGMYVQQGVLRGLLSVIANNEVLNIVANPKSQDRQRELALLGSRKDSNLATIDLQSASDMLSNRLVRWLFEDTPWGELLQIIRTDWIDMGIVRTVDLIAINKYAGMGNATTFPVQTVIYAAIALAVLERYDYDLLPDGTLPLGVFGDDIIIADLKDVSIGMSSYDLLQKVLVSAGLRVNGEKSFPGSSLFKESCGMWALNGLQVTPMYYSRPSSAYLKTAMESDALRWMAKANQAKRLGFKSLHKFYESTLSTFHYVKEKGKTYKNFPPRTTRIEDTSKLHSTIREVLGGLSIRYNEEFQRWEYETITLEPLVQDARPNGRAEIEFTTPVYTYLEMEELKAKAKASGGSSPEGLVVPRYMVGEIESLFLTEKDARSERIAYREWLSDANLGKVRNLAVVNATQTLPKMVWNKHQYLSVLTRLAQFKGSPDDCALKLEDYLKFFNWTELPTAASKQKWSDLLSGIDAPNKGFVLEGFDILSSENFRKYVTHASGLGYQLSDAGKVFSLYALLGESRPRVLSVDFDEEVKILDTLLKKPDAFSERESQTINSTSEPETGEQALKRVYAAYDSASSEMIGTSLREFALGAQRHFELFTEQSGGNTENYKDMKEADEKRWITTWKPFVHGQNTLPDDVVDRLLRNLPESTIERTLFSKIRG